MNKKFFQELMNTMMFKKLTSAFSFLRKEKLSEKDLEEGFKNLQRDGLFDALKNSNQDPKELAEMALEAFDESVKKARERFKSTLNQMTEYLKQKTA